MQHQPNGDGEQVMEVDGVEPLPSTSGHDEREERRSEIKSDAERLVLDAELFRANIEKPIGKHSNRDLSDLSDDQFFHLICHVDSVLMEKIKCGQYVDLEKLLPGDKFRKDNTRLEWCLKDGATFLAPAEKDKKITNVCKWDQAFRTYATIYCREKPDWASEIWQYIDVIHMAAAAYVWDNVARYNYVFRQLMESNPNRSWAITYTQMWNLTLVEPLTKNNFASGSGSLGQGFKKGGGEFKNKNGNNNGNHHKKSSDYCWGLNGKSNFCRYGERCKFVNKCSYCDSPQHGITKCPKLLKDKNDELSTDRK